VEALDEINSKFNKRFDEKFNKNDELELTTVM
jgi:hypothetical protein